MKDDKEKKLKNDEIKKNNKEDECKHHMLFLVRVINQIKRNASINRSAFKCAERKKKKKKGK